MKRGFFIVVEGCDRAGKSTQCQRLVEFFKKEGTPAVSLGFPDRKTTTGKLISQYLEGKTELNDKAIHLLFSANRWEAESKILKTLNLGTTIICDRYAYSGVAYSSAKEGLDLKWCKHPDVGLPRPDLILFLDLPSEIQESRNGFGEEFYEKVHFQTLVREQFFKLKDENWEVINASKTLDQVQSEIITCVKKLEAKCCEEIQRLWLN